MKNSEKYPFLSIRCLQFPGLVRNLSIYQAIYQYLYRIWLLILKSLKNQVSDYGSQIYSVIAY